MTKWEFEFEGTKEEMCIYAYVCVCVAGWRKAAI